jgi:hypothetical protein
MFPSAPAGFVGRVRVSLQSVVNNVELCGHIVKQTLQVEQGQVEYIVATKLLFLDALATSGDLKIMCALAAAATSRWTTNDTTNIETISRNALHVDPSDSSTPHRRVGEVKSPNYRSAMLARIKTILGRDLHPHDREAELAERVVVTQPHYFKDSDEPMCDCWINKLFITLAQYAQEALSTAPNSPQRGQSWWENRAMWLSGGTSSDKMRNTPLEAAINKCGYHVRITKKLACSHMANDWFKKAMASTPAMQCRAATKNEPGLKLRPLRAADDKSYLIAAMASNNLEKYLSIKGSVMRQTPDDVRRTSQAVVLTASNQKKHILCLDYSNFNNTHTTRSRTVLNLAMAIAFEKSGATEHSRAAMWLALAHLNHTIDGHISNQGLSSGERDTARDNTMLHNAYSTMAKNQVPSTSRDGPAITQMCGDDEIAIGATWSWCIRYTLQHRTQGHALQTRKMMLSTMQGEFLQYNMSAVENTVPTQPLAPALNNFVSGSWYKTANYNPTEYPQQAAAAAASCIRRGANHKVMIAMVISTTSWLCDGLPWKMMLHSTPLFGMTRKQPHVERSERVSATTWQQTTQPAAATDYVKALVKRFDLNLQHILVAEKHAAKNIYSTLLADTKNTTYSITEPERDLRVTVPMHAAPMSPKHHAVWATTTPDVRYDETTWLAVQIGVPTELISEIGMRTIVSKANNSVRSHINIPTTRPQALLTPEQYAMLPGAVAPYFRPTTRQAA